MPTVVLREAGTVALRLAGPRTDVVTGVPSINTAAPPSKFAPDTNNVNVPALTTTNLGVSDAIEGGRETTVSVAKFELLPPPLRTCTGWAPAVASTVAGT